MKVTYQNRDSWHSRSEVHVALGVESITFNTDSAICQLEGHSLPLIINLHSLRAVEE